MPTLEGWLSIMWTLTAIGGVVWMVISVTGSLRRIADAVESMAYHACDCETDTQQEEVSRG